MEILETDVLIVGAGPTGLMLAIELGMRGVQVEIIDRAPQPHGQSRGGGISARTCEVLDMRGLYAPMEARALPREGATGHFAGLPLDLDVAAWATRHPGGMAIPQDRVEAVLAERLDEMGVRVRRGAELVALSVQGPEGAAGVATIGDPDGTTTTVAARFVVGADGAHSRVRSLAGIDFPGHPATMSAVSADVELDVVPDTIPRTIGHIAGHTRIAGGYWMMANSLMEPGADAFRVVFGIAGPAVEPERDRAVDPEEVRVALAAVHGPDARLRRVRWATRFGDATRIAATYRRGPVLLAGDAAHIHPPLGGQGLNLGVQDAMNLGWKLAAELTRAAPEGLLASYEAERRPVAESVIRSVRAQRLIMSPTPGTDAVDMRELFARIAALPEANRYLAGMVSGLDIRYPIEGPPPVGSRMPDLDLRTPDHTRVSDLQHDGAALLLDLGVAGDAVPGARHVVATTEDPQFTGRRLLVRPDGYVAWAGPSGSHPRTLDDALATWCAAHTLASGNGRHGDRCPSRGQARVRRASRSPTREPVRSTEFL